MAAAATGLKWGVERRLEFIEFRLFWEGGVNRSDIIEMFDVSVPQASKDLTLYQDRAPQNAIYDKSAKQYIAGERFKPCFLKPDPYGYLSRLRSVAEGLIEPSDSWLANSPVTDLALTPKRDIDATVLRAVLSAMRTGQSVEVLYQSMNRTRPDPIWRRITPHALGFDSFRWHARAFCHVDERFEDFLLPRMLGARAADEPGAEAEEDYLWNNYFEVVIGPHPDLTDSQKSVVAKDYGMEGERRILKVRYAMLFYTLKRLGLLGDAAKEDPRRQHIVAVNREETSIALQKSGFPT